jgi:hypothetical protein
MGLLAVVRPVEGLLVVAALTLVTRVVGVSLGSGTARVTEALVLAYLAGAVFDTLRGRRDRTTVSAGPSRRQPARRMPDGAGSASRNWGTRRAGGGTSGIAALPSRTARAQLTAWKREQQLVEVIAGEADRPRVTRPFNEGHEGLCRTKEKARLVSGPFGIIPATTYSPTELPPQYHRRKKA